MRQADLEETRLAKEGEELKILEALIVEPMDFELA
jgi:hypothetical protein